MSDYSDILYDPRTHTHDSCLKEVPGADVVILIIGSRYGGTAIPSALDGIDFTSLRQMSTSTALLDGKKTFSVTQLEVLKAVEQGIPIYAFVEQSVLHDHHVYEKNKDKADIIEKIDFPSIQKRESAKYIFEFINFLTHRVTNNSITSFGRLDDIRDHLTSQWSQLFQRLILEGRTRAQEERRFRDFSEQIEDLKAVVLASVATPDLREIAKGAIQFRRVISLVSAIRGVDHRNLLLSKLDWNDLWSAAGITEIRSVVARDALARELGTRPELFLIRSDRTFYRSRFSPSVFESCESDWMAFLHLDMKVREAVVAALLEDGSARLPMLMYVDRNIEEYLGDADSRAEKYETSAREFERVAMRVAAEASGPS